MLSELADAHPCKHLINNAFLIFYSRYKSFKTFVANKLLAVLLAALSVTHVAKAQPIKLFVEQSQGVAVRYAQNDEVAPYSIALELNLENMIFSEGSKSTFVTPAKTEKFKMGELTPASNSRYKFSYTFKSVMGN